MQGQFKARWQVSVSAGLLLALAGTLAGAGVEASEPVSAAATTQPADVSATQPAKAESPATQPAKAAADTQPAKAEASATQPAKAAAADTQPAKAAAATQPAKAESTPTTAPAAQAVSAGPPQAKDKAQPSGKSMDQWVAQIGVPGKFDAPALVVAPRPAYGEKGGKAEVLAAQVRVEVSGAIVYVFWIVTLVTVILTVGLVWGLGKTRGQDGSTQHALTIGAKLVAGFGALATLILLVSTMSLSSQHASQAMAEEFGNIVEDAAILEAIQRDVLMVRMNVKDFLISNTDADLKQYSDYMAAVHAKLDKAQKDILNPQRAKMIQAVHDLMEEYEQWFAKAVDAIDTRNGVVNSQLTVAGVRLVQVFEAIIQTAQADGDFEAGLAAAECLDHLALARMNVNKFLRSSDEADAQAAAAGLQEGRQKIQDLAGQIQNANRKKWLAEAEQGFDFYLKKIEPAIEAMRERNSVVQEHLDKLGPTIAAEGVKLVESIRQSQVELQAKTNAAAVAARLQAVVISAVALGVAILVSVWLIKAITRAVNRVLAVLRAVAAGDLTHEPLNITAKDEMGQLARATDQMSESLKSLIAQVTQAASEVASAATEIAASSEEIAAGMNEQSEQVTQISSAVEELNATVTEVAKKSAEAAGNASESGKIAQEGGKVVNQTIEGMSSINQAVTASATAVAELGKRGQQIGQIVDVINDIADQTNLLALNAAIEAARAGEHGRGFAVVADEVRKLADRTTKATEEIAGSIQAIQQETGQAVERMNAGTEQVKAGVESATQAGQSLQQIVASAQGVATMIQAIAAASEEQSAAVEQVSRNIESISAITKQSTEGTQQAAAAAGQLSSKAEQLQAIVKKFRLKAAA
ncbi:MAG: methyl-accepting chemotaxis protein [Phycisphaeraceae bacterium]|nr:methyl-accepting chemotaxis protein [Phycisphaeraceae bacterium]